jgi:hypothetical protein
VLTWGCDGTQLQWRGWEWQLMGERRCRRGLTRLPWRRPWWAVEVEALARANWDAAAASLSQEEAQMDAEARAEGPRPAEQGPPGSQERDSATVAPALSAAEGGAGMGAAVGRGAGAPASPEAAEGRSGEGAAPGGRQQAARGAAEGAKASEGVLEEGAAAVALAEDVAAERARRQLEELQTLGRERWRRWQQQAAGTSRGSNWGGAALPVWVLPLSVPSVGS